MPNVAADPKFAKTHARNAHRDELRDMLHNRLATQTADQWFTQLSEAGLPCAPIQDVRGGIEFAERLGLQPVVLAGTGSRKIPTVRHPVAYSRTPVDYALAPPELNKARNWSATGSSSKKPWPMPEAFRTSVSPRWADQDLNGHVNHAAVVTLMEEARILWRSGVPGHPWPQRPRQ